MSSATIASWLLLSCRRCTFLPAGVDHVDYVPAWARGVRGTKMFQKKGAGAKRGKQSANRLLAGCASWVRLWRDLRDATLSRGIFAPEPAYAILGAFWRVWCGAGVSTSGAGGGGGGRRLTTSPAWLYLG